MRDLLPPDHPESVAGIERELDVLATEIWILVEPKELLRKPKSAKASRRFGDRQDAFRAEARRQVAFHRRTKFAHPAPVSVQMEIHVPEGGQQPLMPGVVKAYLDALQGIAYDDDRQIEHLVVRRMGMDHPMLDGFEPEGSGRPGQVSIIVQPLEAYTRLYDRTFRRLAFNGDEKSPFHRRWRLRDELQLAKVKAERRRLPQDRDPEPTDALIASYEEERLTDAVLADIDRPGPLSTDMRRAFRVFPAHKVQAAIRRGHGSTFLLPLRGQGGGSSATWEADVDRILGRHRAHRLMTHAPLTTWVALDIAVRCESIDGIDLDNLARLVVGRFEEAFCVRPGTVSCYRAYQAVGTPQGVQVRVMNDGRMLALDIALSQTRRALAERVSQS